MIFKNQLILIYNLLVIITINRLLDMYYNKTLMKILEKNYEM